MQVKFNEETERFVLVVEGDTTEERLICTRELKGVAQVVRTGRRVIYRLLGYNHWLADLFAGWERLRRLEPG